MTFAHPERDPLPLRARERDECVLARNRAHRDRQRRPAGSDRARHVGRHVVERQRRRADIGQLRVDEDRVRAADRQRARVDEAAARAERSREDERRAVGLEDRDAGGAARRGADGDVAQLERDPLALIAGERRERVLARNRPGRDGYRRAGWRDGRRHVRRHVVERERHRAGRRLLRVDEDPVLAGRGQRACVDEPAVRPDERLRAERSAVGLVDPDVGRAARRRADRDAAHAQRDALVGLAAEA